MDRLTEERLRQLDAELVAENQELAQMCPNPIFRFIVTRCINPEPAPPIWVLNYLIREYGRYLNALHRERAQKHRAAEPQEAEETSTPLEIPNEANEESTGEPEHMQPAGDQVGDLENREALSGINDENGQSRGGRNQYISGRKVLSSFKLTMSPIMEATSSPSSRSSPLQLPE